jgi:EAL domain-containing protein (putative c-di-GMP-specific phosphodiesterase class I)
MQAGACDKISSDTLIDARATMQAGVERIYAGIPQGRDWAFFPFNSLKLGSHFQPIFCVTERRCIGYEGLLRAGNSFGQAVTPETVFAVSANRQEKLFLDWLCRALHLRNFNNLAGTGDWVFLNAYPESAIEDPCHPQVFANMIEFYGIDPKNVVVEILETGVSDEARLIDAAGLYRSLGCQIAIDDFGVGYSNFDRLWRVRPDFVKIDRSVTVSALRDTHARLVLANMVKLIQQCGAQVIVEGIETRDEALMALGVGADFLQGYFFARPGLAPLPQARCDDMFAGLLGHVHPSARPPGDATPPDLDTHARALNLAVLDLQRGGSFARAAESFLSLPQVRRIYLATADGDDVAGVDGRSGRPRLVLDLIENAMDASADEVDATGSALNRLQQMLQQALSAPHQVHVSADAAEAQPASAPCADTVTLCCAFELDQRMVVLCGDLVDPRSAGPAATRGRGERNAGSRVLHLHL